MKSILALLVLVGIFRAGESAVTAWTSPSITLPATTGTLTAKINDGVTTGATGTTITATAGGTITYAKVSQDPSSPVLAIDGSTGDITVTSGTVSYSSVTSFTLVVTAADAGDSTTGTATVTLNVNAAPSFSSHSNPVCIVDGATEGKDLIDLTATDANTGTTITYAIEAAGNTNTDFEIKASGLVQMAAGKTLDMASTPSYTLVITATDDSSTPLTGTTTVTATVSSVCSGAAALAVTFMTVLSALIISLQ